MNLFLLSAPPVDGKFEVLALEDGRRFDHIVGHLGLKLGSSLRFGVIGRGKGVACLVERCSSRLVFAVKEYVDCAAHDVADIELLIALPRPQMVKRILETCSTFGVRTIRFIHSEKVEKNYWQSPVLADAAIQQSLLLGAEQAGSTFIPSIVLHRPVGKRTKSFIDTAETFNNKTIVLHPGPYPLLEAHKHADSSDIRSILIGPEGGFSANEIAKLSESCVMFRSLGSRILRVETAVTAVLSRVCL